MRRVCDPQAIHVGAVLLGLLVAKRAPVDPELAGAHENRVVNVGDVLDVCQRALRREPACDADERVELDEGEGVAEMRRVVGSDAAHVHTDRAVRDGRASLGQRIAQ